MSEKVQVSGGGISFLGLLTILFIGLKLTGYVQWSWLWVLSLLWIPLAAVIGVIAVCMFIAVACTAAIAVIERYGQ